MSKLFNRTNAQARSLPKLIAVLGLLSLAIGAAIVFGVRIILEKRDGASKPAQTVAAETAPPAAAPETPPAPETPAALKAARNVINGSAQERKAAIQSLKTFTEVPPETIAELTDALTSSSAVKTDVIWALAVLGPKAVSAAPALKKIAANKKETVEARKAARAALAKIEPKPKAAPKSKKKGRSVKRKKR